MSVRKEKFSIGLKVALSGLGVAAVGVFLGFFFYGIGFLPGAQFAFFIILAGIVVGFFGIGIGWLKDGPRALHRGRRLWRYMALVFSRHSSKDKRDD